MKKIPTLFERVFENHKIIDILPNVIPGMEWVLNGEGDATIKWDGSCCAIINGELYKRYDGKKGRKIPEGAIPCCDPDPVTGHYPHWIKCDQNNPSDKWFFSAYNNSKNMIVDGTYEAIGKHFNGNPYNFKEYDILVKHGTEIIPNYELERSFNGIKEYLKQNAVEGIVFWKDREPKCKIKRTDFGFEWPIKNKK